MDKKRSPGPAKQLTNQQIKFSQILVYGVEGIPVSKMEAAKLAGYADSAPHGSRLTNPNHYPRVCAYISNLRDEVRQKYGISFESHLEELGKIRDRGKKDNKNLAAAATTEIARGKAAGYYIDQKIIRHGNIDDMNLDQLYARMKTIKDRNKKVLEAKKLLANAESQTENTEPEVKKLPSLEHIDDQD